MIIILVGLLLFPQKIRSFTSIGYRMWTIRDTELLMSMLKLTGWVEVDGRRLTEHDHRGNPA